MRCRVADLRNKEVVNIASGCRLGFVDDVAADTESGQILALIVPGPWRLFGLLGRGEDYVLPWPCVQRIGDDIILVDVPGEIQREKWLKRAT